MLSRFLAEGEDMGKYLNSYKTVCVYIYMSKILYDTSSVRQVSYLIVFR